VNRLELIIRIHNIESEEIARDIFAALEEMWKFQDASFTPDSGIMEGEGIWTTSLDEEVFVDRLTKAIWKKTGFGCKIEMDIVRVDENPISTYDRCQADYERIMAIPDPVGQE
jgi:hypothetical protein